ncbi:hypothetical protein QRD43_01820 [Pelomonas sp. APW6]|uniref:Uncharacterized protein n=1 Tax=Roseateles subflavus TaxID=3053353 RepID=A0ABT7LCP2_9BURK|nr:hypothetical protein [Pelomonas sp. APW6]MDL5030629.1 hypothetical protein [Pelomonas sp. APW6]
MMKVQPSDLILRFDADGNDVLLLVPKSPTDVATLKQFFAVPVPVGVTVSEFASEMGAAVASFLHARHRDRFEVIETLVEDEVLESTEAVTFGDARLLIDRLGEDSDLADLQAIDALLQIASEQGDAEAESYLHNRWPQLRTIFVRRISRK